MVIFQNEVINNGNDEQILFVQRSGRLSNRQRPNRDNEHYETMDLTIDGDSEDKQDNVIDGASGNVIEGENVDNEPVSDKEKEKSADVENNVAKEKKEVEMDKRIEKLVHRRSGNVKDNDMDNDFVSDKGTEQAGTLKNVEEHKKMEEKRGNGREKMEHEREGNGTSKILVIIFMNQTLVMFLTFIYRNEC